MASYKKIANDNPIKKIIDDYTDESKGYKPIDDGREVPEYKIENHREFLEKIYQDRSGVCEHRVLAVEYKLACNKDVKKDDYRVVLIDENHVRLEVRFENKWHIVDVGGALAPEIEIDEKAKNMEEGEGKKYKSQALGGKTRNVNFEEEAKEEKEKEKEEREREEAKEEAKEEEEKKRKAENSTLPILMSCLEKNIIPSKINSKEDLIKKVFPNNSFDFDRQKTLILTKEVESHANFILENAKKDGRECYYIDNSNKIDFNRLNLFVLNEEEEKNRSIFKNEGLLHDFLNKEMANDNERKPLLLINWQSFTSHQRLALNTLLDKKGRIYGKEVNCDIVGLCEEKTDDHSFLTRHNLLLESQLKFNNRKNLTSEKSEPVDIQGFDGWKQTLFGRVEVNGDEMLWQKSDFVKKIEAGVKNFEIFNIDKKSVNLQYEFNQAKALGYFSYHGYKILLPEDFDIKIAKESFNFRKFSATNIFVKNNITFANAPLDCHLLNAYLFDEVLRKKKVSDGFYKEEDGLIEQCAKSSSDKVLELFISSDLSDGQWYSLFNQAQKNEVKLNLYLAPTIKIPNQVNKTSMRLEAKNSAESLNLEDLILERKIPKIYITNDISNHTKNVVADLIQEDEGNIEEKFNEDEEINKWQEDLKKANVVAIIDVEDMSYQDLIERIGFEISKDGFKNFEKKESEVLTALESGQKVILRGIFAEELLQMLEPIFVSRDSKLQILKDNLILIIEDNCKNNSYYEPLKWLSNSDYQISKYNTKPLFDKIELLENIELSSSLDNSEEKSQNFIKERKENFSRLLEENKMLRLVGHSGVGKSGLIKEFKNNNPNEIEIYRELTSFENWANDKSNKQKILFIDESNIEDTHFTIFSPLKKGGNKRLLHHGKFYDLDENHKVVFASNPKEYGGGRVVQKLFDDGEIPVMYLRDFSASYIYEELLKKPIFNGLNQYLKNGEKPIFTESKFKEICQNLIEKYQEVNLQSRADEANKETVRELQEKVLLALDNFSQNKYKEIRDKNFVSTDATFDCENALRKFISIRENQRNEIFTDKMAGLNGFLLEGDSGIGKSEMIDAILRDKQISERKLENENISSGLSFYKIDANMSLDIKKEIVAKAYEEGNIIRIDEINSCIDDGFEKILNLAMTGDHPLGKNIQPQAGFMVISSINSVASEGRSQISPAMLHRFNVVRAKSLKEYSPTDISKILDNIVGHNDGEFGEYVIKEEYSEIIDRVANDFCKIKQNNKSFNLRLLNSSFSEIYEKYHEDKIEKEIIEPDSSSLVSPTASKLKDNQHSASI